MGLSEECHGPVAGLVSCIVPAHNAAASLPTTVESVLAQTYGKWELIVVDDGSTDETGAVAARYPGTVLTTPQAGPPIARNAGLAASRGQYVALLDADDVWHPTKLARQVERLAADASIGVVATHAVDVVNGLAVTAPVACHNASALMIRRSVFDDVGAFAPERRHTDVVEWLLRARRRGVSIDVLAELLVFRRRHRDGLSVREPTVKHKELLGLAVESVRGHHRFNQRAGERAATT